MSTMIKAKDLMNYDHSLLLGEFYIATAKSTEGRDGRLVYHTKTVSVDDDGNRNIQCTLCLIVTDGNIEFCPMSDESTKLIHEKFDFN